MDSTLLGVILAGMGSSIVTMAGFIVTMYRKTAELIEARSRCEAEYTVMKSRVDGMLREIDTLRSVAKDLSEHPACVWMKVLTTGIAIDVGGPVKSLLGYRPSELIGRDISILVPEEDKVAHHRGLDRVAHGGGIRSAALAVSIIRKNMLQVSAAIVLTVEEFRGERIVKALIFELTSRKSLPGETNDD